MLNLATPSFIQAAKYEPGDEDKKLIVSARLNDTYKHSWKILSIISGGITFY